MHHLQSCRAADTPSTPTCLRTCQLNPRLTTGDHGQPGAGMPDMPDMPGNKPITQYTTNRPLQRCRVCSAEHTLAGIARSSAGMGIYWGMAWRGGHVHSIQATHAVREMTRRAARVPLEDRWRVCRMDGLIMDLIAYPPYDYCEPGLYSYPIASSTIFIMASTFSSSNDGPTIWTPTGRPSILLAS